MDRSEYLTVSQLTKYIKTKFDRDPYLERVFLTGEVSNYKGANRSGHCYFNVKDDGALISAVIFKRQFQQLSFELEEGMKVLITGHVSVYERSGVYQIIITDIQPDGVGALYAAYEQLKKKLAKEGLFQFTPRPIPRFPKKIAVVTSRTGAVIHDIMTTTRRRFPKVQLVLYPTAVQGQQSAESIVHNLRRIEADGSYDTVIVGRGGGSIEDLWSFNDETVVRTVAAMKTPVITSVGHETDTPLIDYVADQRAATPTAAAELATPVLSEVLAHIQDMKTQLFYAERNHVTAWRERLKQVQSSYVFLHPSRLYDGYKLHLQDLITQLDNGMGDALKQREQQWQQLRERLSRRSPREAVQHGRTQLALATRDLSAGATHFLESKRNRLERTAAQLDLLSPLKRLGNGYAYVTNAVSKRPLNSYRDVKRGDAVQITLTDGTIATQVTETLARTKEEN